MCYREHTPRDFPREASYSALWENMVPNHQPPLGLQRYKNALTSRHFVVIQLRIIPASSNPHSFFALTRAMFPTASLSSFLFLALSVAASPVVVRNTLVSLPFARQFNITGALDVVQKDQARAKDLLSISQAKQSGTINAGAVVGVGVTDVGVVYQASVGVGSPPTDCERSCFTYGLHRETCF